MIAYIKGKLTLKTPAFVLIETGGIGYHVNISVNTYAKLESLEEIQLWTYLNVKEDSHTLYGFFEEEERSLFTLLISVSGIGPNTARVILSSLTPSEARQAILQEHVQSFNKIKGIGPKTAKRIILDLKDKVMKLGVDEPISLIEENNTVREEALSAMMALGFQKSLVEKTINKIIKEDSNITKVEDLIKLVLKQLS